MTGPQPKFLWKYPIHGKALLQSRRCPRVRNGRPTIGAQSCVFTPPKSGAGFVLVNIAFVRDRLWTFWCSFRKRVCAAKKNLWHLSLFPRSLSISLSLFLSCFLFTFHNFLFAFSFWSGLSFLWRNFIKKNHTSCWDWTPAFCSTDKGLTH